MSHPIRSLLAASTAILFALPIVSSQAASIVPSNLPACASTCPALVQAQAACAPTVAQGQAALKGCFCQSAYLQPINSAGTNVCAPICTDADFGSISGWFKGFCASNAPAPAPGAAPAPAPAPAPGAAAPAPAPADATPSSSAQTNEGIDENQSGAQWWSSHWKWVVMLVVLAVGLAAIGIIGTIFYRRYKKKREYGDNTAPRPDLHNWAPAQANVHDFGATGAPVNQNALNEKDKGKDPVGVTRGRSGRGSQRLRKFQA